MPLTILLVDKRDSDRLTLQNILGERYTVNATADAKAAERELQGKTVFAAVLLAESVDSEERLALLRLVRQTPALSEIPVVFIAYSASSGKAALALGMDEFVLDPVDPDILVHRINTVTELKKLRAACPSKGETEGLGEVDDVTFAISKSMLALMDDAPGGFARMRLKPDGKLSTEYVNESLCRMRGMSLQEIIQADSENAFIAIHPDDLEPAKALLMEVLNTGEKRHTVYRLLHSDGTYIPLNVYGSVTKNEAGETFVNLFYTELNAEESGSYSLQETLPFILSAIMKSSPNLDFAKDKDFKYICCSPGFVKFSRHKSEADIIGKTDYDIWTKEEADHFRRDDLKLFESGESLVDYTEPIPSDDDVQHYSVTSKYLLRNSAGEIIGLYGTGRDVTDTRAALDQLTLLTDTMPGGMATYAGTPQGVRIKYFNDGFCRLIGCTREEYEVVAGTGNVLSSVYPEDRPRLDAQIERLIKDGTPLDIVYRINKMDGSGIIWVSEKGVVIQRSGDTVFANVVFFNVTELKNAEQALRIHEKELEYALSHMGRMISEYDIAGKTLVLSEAYARRYGLERINHNVPDCYENTDRFTPEMYEIYRSFYDSILRGDKSGIAELQKQDPKGGLIWERMEFVSVFDEAGKPVKALIASDDTTEQHLRYELEQKRPTLSEKNLLIHALFDLNSGETLDYSLSGGGAVPMMQRLSFSGELGNAEYIIPDEAERRRFLELNDRAHLLELYEKGETDHVVDYRRRLSSGEIRWMRNVLRMVRKPGGENVLLFEYCYDVEDEKTQELMLESLIKTGYDFVIRLNGITNAFHTISGSGAEYSSPPAWGDDFDSALGELVERTVHPEDRVALMSNALTHRIHENLKLQNRFQFGFRELQSDGSVRYKRITVYYIDRSREIIIITREDVTELMQKEEQKNKALSEALSAAKQASLAKSTFLSRMSHELRTPMNAIIGLSTLSASELGNEQVIAENIEKIGLSARFLLSLINDILEMSRIESGKLTLNQEPFDFEEFISGVSTIIYSQAAAKGLEYDVVIRSYTEPDYIGDATKLQEILLNILGNAVKFTPSGGKITMSVEQLQRVKERVTLRFVISDTGVGIDEKFMPHLFDAFSQESSSYTSTSTGTGLGLAISKNLVEMMNGHISVKSIKDVGSVFTVDVVLGISESSRQHLDTMASVRLDKLSTLVVDDDVVICRNTERIMKTMGMQAEWVASGAEAVSKVLSRHAENKDYNAIFIDWKMPDMDGIETTRRIRRVVGPDVTIVIMTAFDWRSIEREAREAGVDMFMEKPLFQSSIVKAFEKVFMANRESLAPPKPEIFDFSGKHFLLAEDHPINIEVARRLLEKTGAAVTVATNGVEAIECFATAPDGFYDLILMDIRMPEMDGLTASKSIRKLKKAGSKTIPIIAMTANAFDEDVELSMRSGMNAHLTKPIDPPLLYSTIRRFLGNREGEHAQF